MAHRKETSKPAVVPAAHELAVLAAIRRLSRELGIPPTRREIARATFKTFGRVGQIIEDLEDAGLVRRNARQSRCLWLTASGEHWASRYE